MPDPDAAGQEAPMGVSSATGPTPNAGAEAGGMQILGVAMKQLTNALPMLGASSEAGQMVLDFLKKLGKLMPDGSVTPAAEKNVMEQQMLKAAQQAQMIQQIRAQQAQQAQGGGQGAPQAPSGPPQAQGMAA